MNSRLSWYLDLASLSMSICFCMRHLLKHCCRILQLLINYHSFLAAQLTLWMGTLPGNIASTIWQQMAPVPSCSIRVTSRFNSLLTHSMRSPLGTKNAPSMMPMACCQDAIQIFVINTHEQYHQGRCWVVLGEMTKDWVFLVQRAQNLRKPLSMPSIFSSLVKSMLSILRMPSASHKLKNLATSLLSSKGFFSRSTLNESSVSTPSLHTQGDLYQILVIMTTSLSSSSREPSILPTSLPQTSQASLHPSLELATLRQYTSEPGTSQWSSMWQSGQGRPWEEWMLNRAEHLAQLA